MCAREKKKNSVWSYGCCFFFLLVFYARRGLKETTTTKKKKVEELQYLGGEIFGRCFIALNFVFCLIRE